MGLSITRAADYALRAMVYISCLPEDAVVLGGKVAETQRIPPSFTAKILRRLVRAGLLRSVRGAHGGFSLNRPATRITLLDVVEAIEGPICLTPCAVDGKHCELWEECPGSLVWPPIQESLNKMLRSLSLEDLANAPRRNGRLASLPGIESAKGSPEVDRFTCQ